MELVSRAEVDEHAALHSLVKAAIAGEHRRIADLKTTIAELRKEQQEFDALPFYLRWFSWPPMSPRLHREVLYTSECRLDFLEQIQYFTTCLFTIKLSNSDVDALYSSANYKKN